jgi:hypothetical protein
VIVDWGDWFFPYGLTTDDRVEPIGDGFLIREEAWAAAVRWWVLAVAAGGEAVP